MTLWEVYGSTEIGLGSGLGPGLPAQARHDGPPVPPGRGGRSSTRTTTRCRRAGSARPCGGRASRLRSFQGYWNLPQATLDVCATSGSTRATRACSTRRATSSSRTGSRTRSAGAARTSRRSTWRWQSGPSPACRGGGLRGVGRRPRDGRGGDDRGRSPARRRPGAGRALPRALPRRCPGMPCRAISASSTSCRRRPPSASQKFKLRADGVTPDALDREALGIFPPRD